MCNGVWPLSFVRLIWLILELPYASFPIATTDWLMQSIKNVKHVNLKTDLEFIKTILSLSNILFDFSLSKYINSLFTSLFIAKLFGHIKSCFPPAVFLINICSIFYQYAHNVRVPMMCSIM